MNPFVVGNFPKMKEFLDALSLPLPNDNSLSQTPPIKLEKEV